MEAIPSSSSRSEHEHHPDVPPEAPLCIRSLDPQDLILRKLSRQRFVIPDLKGLFPDWEFKFSPDYGPDMRSKIDEWLLSWLVDESSRKHVRPLDTALLMAAFYPEANREELYLAGCYHGWLFMWDDVFDVGLLFRNLEGTFQYLKDARSVMREARSSGPATNGDALRPDLHPAIQKMGELIITIRDRSSPSAFQRFIGHLEDYVEAVAWFAALRHQRAMPTLEDYFFLRDRCAGTNTTIALLEYIYDLNLPDWVFEDDAIRKVAQLSGFLVFVANDLVSFANEFAGGQVDNLISLLVYHKGLTLQAAVDCACRLLRESAEAFDDAERRLPIPTGDAKLDADILRFVKGCKQIAAGNVAWSYGTGRYFEKYSVLDGRNTVSVELPRRE